MDSLLANARVKDRKQRNSFGAKYRTINKVEVPTIIRDYHVAY